MKANNQNRFFSNFENLFSDKFLGMTPETFFKNIGDKITKESILETYDESQDEHDAIKYQTAIETAISYYLFYDLFKLEWDADEIAAGCFLNEKYSDFTDLKFLTVFDINQKLFDNLELSI